MQKPRTLPGQAGIPAIQRQQQTQSSRLHRNLHLCHRRRSGHNTEFSNNVNTCNSLFFDNFMTVSKSILLKFASAALFLCRIGTADAQTFLGTLRTIAHQVTGDVYLLNENAMEIRGFTYDGTGPAAFFWADSDPSPSRNGIVLPDGSPSIACAASINDPALPRLTSVTQRVEFPPGSTIRDFLGGSLSVWCERFDANFGDIQFPATLDEADIPSTEIELECAPRTTFDPPTFLGTLRTIAHQVTGDVYLLNENAMEIRGFTYDGTGPAAFFWADSDPSPTRNGIVLPDGSPSSACAASINDPALPRLTSVTQRVEFPPGSTIRDFLGGSLSVWCERFDANFGDIQFPATLDEADIPSTEIELECATGTPSTDPPIPGIARTPTGYNCEPLNDDFQVRWNINGDTIDIELLGDIPDDAYMAFGVSGSTDRTKMIGADPVIADVPTSDGVPRARDYFMDAQAQCSGEAGVCADTENPAHTNDVTNVSGEKDSGLTLVRYTHPLVPSDVGSISTRSAAIDRAIPVTAGIETFIVWAIGPISPQTSNPNFHSIGYARQDQVDVTLDFGRGVVDNCEPLVNIPTETPPPPPFSRPFINDTVIEAHIGPSGGARGYSSITEGLVSWGIAWYMNGQLIPELVFTRGTTYTFRVNGGNDVSDDARYHPLYITTSEFGGYLQLSPEERLEETPLAGITITETDETTGGVIGFDVDVEGLAPICLYETTAATPEAELGTFEEYVATLDTTCADDEELIDQVGIITFTPDESTPDVIYYHCVTHRNLGFKINVIDPGEVFTTEPTDVPVEEPVLDEFTIVALEEQLEGATLNFKFNFEDERAAGKDTITVILEVPAEGWAGWAVNDNGGSMVGSEAVIGLPNTGEVKKYALGERSVSGVQPMPENQQTLIDASVRQIGGNTILTFTKILLEPNEIPITDSGIFLSAWGFTNNLGIHAKRGAFAFSGAVIETRKQNLWKVHGWLASFAWAVLSPLAIASSVLRQFLPQGSIWFNLHRGLNTMVILFTFAAFIVAIVAINQETPSGAETKHFNSSLSEGHRSIGLAIFILAILQALAGIFRPHTPEKADPADEEDGKPDDLPEEKSSIRTIWEIGHRVIGWGLLGLSWYQLQLGIKIYSDFFNGGDTGSMLAALWAVMGTLGAIILVGYGAKFLLPTK